ncbi:MAG TPA: cytochrome c family protein [Caulobacteraceae bacterium]|nr:cytochrome c family protein [Caulobacteraceae bacterium]
MFHRLRILTVAGLCALASACGPSGAPQQSASTPPAAAPAPAPAAAPAISAAATAAVAALPAPYNTGDIDNGHAKFALCQACHSILPGAPNMTGPNLNGVVGRMAGSAPGYSYSDAMKGAGWTWDAQHLDTWLAGPQKMLPGAKMTFVGLANPQDRIDVIAYLASAGAH